MIYNIDKIRSDFPILKTGITYLDSAATAMKPTAVVEAMNQIYYECNGNVGRGNSALSIKCSHKYEEAREKVKDFIDAKESAEVIFTSGTTASINIIAFGVEHLITNKHNIVVSGNEHNSNFYAWKRLCEKKGAELRIIPTKESGAPDYWQMTYLIDENTAVVSVTAASNVTGIRTHLELVGNCANKHGAIFVVDSAQRIPHCKLSVQDIDCDFMAFSGHKIYSDTGIGVLYGKRKMLEILEPVTVGSNMIDTRSGELSDLPLRFEVGTTHYIGAISMGAAIDYLNEIGMDNIESHEQKVNRYLTKCLLAIKDVQIIGSTEVYKCPIVSFIVQGCNAYDISELLSAQTCMVRSGRLCSESVMRDFSQEAVIRCSIGIYNTFSDIDHFIKALKKSIEMLRRRS